MSGANFTPENIRDDDDSRLHRSKTRNNFNYIALALNAVQKYFADALQEVSDRVLKPALRGGFLVNDIRYFGTLANAAAMIPTGTDQTVFLTNAQAVTDNLTIPSTIALTALNGGSIAITAAKVLTINGPFDANGQTLAGIFSGAGTYAFGQPVALSNTGSPEAVVTAPPGSSFFRTDGGSVTTLYVKESGTGNTGWVPYVGSLSSPTFTALSVGTAAAGGVFIILGKTGFTNDYVFDTTATAGRLVIQVSSATDRFVSFLNTSTGNLGLQVEGRINVNGASDTSGYHINVLASNIAASRVTGSGGRISSWGVGVPGDTDFEYLDMVHDSTNGAIFTVAKGGTGSYRKATFVVGGASAMIIETDQSIRPQGEVQFATAGKGVVYQAGPKDWAGSGSPEGVVTSGIGSTYRRSDGGAGTSFYVKESGAGNTGWVGK